MRYSLDVRYSECDMQKVVHNSVYLRWCDDLADAFFRDLAVGFDSGTWDAMVYVCVVPGTLEPAAVPQQLRDAVER